MPEAPLVTVLMAVHDGEPYLHAALQSILRQTVDDFELVVVDDASSDHTPAILAATPDSRLRVVQNETQLGLARSLNRGLDEARGRYVARLDADDVAMPTRLEQQLERMRASPAVSIVGAGVLELDGAGRPGRVHVMPRGPTAVRFSALFSSPFFHPTVLVERDVLERNALGYDEAFAESEDYDLWARLLDIADGDNVLSPLVLYRVHANQASQRRRALQRQLQLRVAHARIAGLAPKLSDQDVELAWCVGVAERVGAGAAEAAAEAYLELVRAFEREFGRAPRDRVARDLARAARYAQGTGRSRIFSQAVRLEPRLAAHVARDRRRRSQLATTARAEAKRWLDELVSPAAVRRIRVAAVFPEPTPYRAPLLDRIAALPELDLTVIYAASTVARRTWRVEPRHPAVFLRGVRLPGARSLLHHDYPLTPGLASALSELEPDVVVVSGWSTFAAQAAIAWCRLKGVPYVLVVESHDEGPRAGWRRRVKDAVVPPIVRGASGVLVTGTLARDSMLARGAAPEHVRVFANTVDVEAFGERVDALAPRRDELRAGFDAGPDDVVVLSVARLAREKAHVALVEAVAEADDTRIVLALVGEGPDRRRLEALAQRLGVRLVLVGDVEWELVVEAYAAADVFALLSEREPWGVVVNEAAACGLPLVLSDRVGAAHDLLRDGWNGMLVHGGDVELAARALRELTSDPELRRVQGARSRELARDWGYGPSVAGFLAAVREAVVETR